jgi:hypothetical protein
MENLNASQSYYVIFGTRFGTMGTMPTGLGEKEQVAYHESAHSA